MDIKAYISSGQIEACLLGMASEQEMRQMESLCQKYPEVRKEAEKVKQTLEDYASLHAVEPSNQLREDIWNALETADQNSNKTTGKPSQTKAETRSLQRKKNNTRRIKYLAVAAVVVLVVSILGNIYLWRQHKASRSEVTQLERQIQDLEQSYSDRTAAQQRELKLALSPRMERVLLSGVKSHKDTYGLVLWDQNSREVYLSLADLPDPPKGKQYQLWAIVDGKPISAGLYTKSASIPLLQKMQKVSSKAQKFAVTLEKKGGVDAPTMSAMFVAGAI